MIPTSALVEKVRLLINEPDDDVALTALSEDTRKLGDTIKLLLHDAIFFVQHNKSYGALNPAVYEPTAPDIKENGDGTGEILLPSDFVSLLQFRLEGWERPCTLLYPADSVMAIAQKNTHTRAGVCKPVCIEGVNSDAKPVLCYYSLPVANEPVVRSFVYEALYDEEKGLNSAPSNPLVQAVVYQCVALLYNMFERRESANAFMSLAQLWCNKGKTE